MARRPDEPENTLGHTSSSNPLTEDSRSLVDLAEVEEDSGDGGGIKVDPEDPPEDCCFDGDDDGASTDYLVFYQYR
jgi:hypothetical protein